MALRQLKSMKTRALKRAVNTLVDQVSGLDKTQYTLLQRTAYLMDMLEQVSMNRTARANGVPENELLKMHSGWSEDTVVNLANRFYGMAMQDPDVKAAWLKRNNVWFQLRSNYKDAMDRHGMDVSRKLARAYYFRHQILDVMHAQNRYFGVTGSNKLAVPTRSSFLRGRKDTTGRDINLNYIQAEFEVMAQMQYDTDIANTLADIMDKYGSKDEVEGWTRFQPREGSVFYMVNTVPGWIVNRMAEQGLTEANVKKDQIKKALAMGGKYEGYWLPPDLAQTLEEALKQRPHGKIYGAMRKAISMWKIYQLLNPLRAIKYSLRNVTGDAEAAFIGSPAVFNYVPSVLKDLYTWKKTGVAPPSLQEWFDFGGMESTFTSVEITELVKLPSFRKQLGKRMEIGVTPAIKAWFKGAKLANEYREAILRYAAYKHFKAEIAKGNGKPKRYVASLPEEVDAVDDWNSKAYMMSNDLLGAYDRMTAGGDYIREAIIPFWSFQEVNFKRTLVMFRNAMNNDEAVATVGRYLGAKTPVIALKLGMLGLRFMALSALMQGWNSWYHKEEEDMLPEEMANKPHLILGSYKVHGRKSIMYFPRVGVVGDFLEWFGLETAPSDARDIMKLIVGGKSKEQIHAEFMKIFGRYDYGKENLYRVFNKLVQGLGPQYKLLIEKGMGEKLFPSFRNRQPITDEGRWVAEQFGLHQIYDWFSGRPQRKGELKRALRGLTIYEEDANRLGWLATKQRIVDYQRKHGLRGKGFIVTETGTALYNVGLAWRYGDMEALAKYYAEYLFLNMKQLKERNYDDLLEEQIEKLHPLAGLSEIHRDRFMETLGEKGAKQLAAAYAYWGEIGSGVQFVEGK